MGRLFGIVLIVAAVYVGIEVYQEGVSGAFGGIFAEITDPPASREDPNRALDAFQRAYNKSEERVARQLGPDSPDDSGDY